jgi:hypothetical protein
MTYTPYIWPPLVAAAILSGIAIYVRRFKGIPAAGPFGWLMRLMAIWATLSTLSNATVELPLSVLWTQLVYASNAFVSFTILITVLEYAGQGRWMTKRRMALLLVIPVSAAVLSLTSGHHSLWMTDFRLQIIDGLPVLSFSRGPLFWVATVYYFCMNVTALGLMLASISTFKVNPWINLFLLFSLVVPLATAVLFNFGISPIRGYNFTPITFIWTGGLFLWALLRFRMFSFIPVARNMVMDTIQDPVMVLNNQGVLVDFNRAARAAFGIPADAIGRAPGFLPLEWQGLFSLNGEPPGRGTEMALGDGDKKAIYELTTSLITDGSGTPQGRLFLLHDVTRRKSAEDSLQRRTLELKSRNEELQKAVDTIKTMSGLIPICAWCGRKIKNKKGDWVGIEAFIHANSEAMLTHGICPECFKTHMEKP